MTESKILKLYADGAIDEESRDALLANLKVREHRNAQEEFMRKYRGSSMADKARMLAEKKADFAMAGALEPDGLIRSELDKTVRRLQYAKRHVAAGSGAW